MRSPDSSFGSDDRTDAEGFVISGSEKKQSKGVWLGAGLFAVIGLFPMAIGMPIFIKPGIPNPVTGLLELLALAFALRAGWLTLRVKRFGDPALSLTRSSVPRGGIIEGRIELGPEIRTAPEFQLRLQCIHSYIETGTRNNHTVENVLWSGTARAHLLPGGSVPISITVPAGQPATRGGWGGDRILWRLRVTAPFAGVSFSEAYEIPVSGETAEATTTHRAHGGFERPPSDDELPDAVRAKRFTFFFAPVFGIAAIVLGAILLCRGLADVRTGAASTDWPTAPGSIIQSDPGQTALFGQPQINYTYKVADHAYTGSTILPHMFWSRGERVRLARQFPRFSASPVHYSPTQPARSCLLPGLRPQVFQRAAAGLAVVTLGAMITFSGLCAPRYGVVRGNTISFPEGSMPSRVSGALCLAVLAEAVVVWLLT